MIDFLLNVLAYVIALLIVQFINKKSKVYIDLFKKQRELKKLQDKMGLSLDNFFDNEYITGSILDLEKKGVLDNE